MTSTLESFMEKHKTILNKQLMDSVSRLDAPQILKEAMAYSLEAGGKRIRPLLLFAVLDSFGKAPEIGLSTASALEMIHTYSLIHDDLPSMDNDDLRRGKPTNHKVFGEAMAILAGDGLLTYSFQLITEDKNLNDSQKVELLQLLSKCAGPEGMVAGQVADMEGEKKELGLDELKYIHIHKTGKLLSFSVLAGAIIGGADSTQLDHFTEFSHHLGLSFQISDDILDVTGDQELMGKPVGSDTGSHKSTYPSVLTLKGAREQLAHHIEEAKKSLSQTTLNTAILSQITDLVAERTY